MSTAEPYEAEAIAEIKAWFAETSREVYTFGPLLPFGQKAIEGEQRQSEKSAEIAKFMQTTLESHGPKSLLYVRYCGVPLADFSNISCSADLFRFGVLVGAT